MVKLRRAVCVACLVLLSGCGSKPYQTVGGRQAAQTGNISTMELRGALDEFGTHTVASIKESASLLEDANSSRGAQKIRLMARVHLIQAFQTMIQQEDPLIAFVETWGLSRRLTQYFEDGQGSILFGSNQPTIVSTAKNIESQIEKIGARFLNAQTFDETLSLIQKFANQNPINGSFTNLLVYAVETVPGEPSPFSNLIGVPMAPFKAVEGVDRTASSIYGVRNSMERFTDTISDLPEAARWQLMLLLMDLENVDTIQQFMDNMTSFSQSSEKLVTLMNDYPERMRLQASALIVELDEKQTGMQATMEKARQTALAMEKTAAQIQQTIDVANETMDGINKTAAAWQEAADATSEALGIIKGWTDAPRQGPSTFKITDYRDVAVETTHAAAELRAVLSEADGEISSMIDHITWRLAQVILLVFATMAVYRVAFAGRLAKKKEILHDQKAA